MFKKGCYFFKIVCIVIVVSSCNATYLTQNFDSQKKPPEPNYQDEENWAILPSKYTLKLQEIASQDIDALKADVFYVYPTLITNKKDDRWNVSLQDTVQNKKVLNVAVHFQASAWATSGKLYVPFYRQAHLRSYSHLEKGGEKALMLAYRDIKAAFKTYLEKYNKNRPIIIAGHSQGTTHCRLLLRDFFDDKPLQKRLIAAYLPGIGIEKDAYNTLQVMTKANETGGFISWNTYRKNSFPKNYEARYKGKVTTNPITWNLLTETDRSMHKGFLYSNDKIYDKALKIQTKDGLVWTTLPRFPLRIFALFKKNYHVGDVNLFWSDIKENAELRVKSWFENQ